MNLVRVNDFWYDVNVGNMEYTSNDAFVLLNEKMGTRLNSRSGCLCQDTGGASTNFYVSLT